MKSAAPHLDVRVYDAAPEGVWEKDERASAIAAGAKRLLTVLGAWDEIAPESEPIRKMIITDSKTADPVRPVFLTFDGEAEAGEPFAYMVPNPAMVRSLRKRAEVLGVEIRQGVSAVDFKTGDAWQTVTLSNGETIDAAAAGGLRWCTLQLRVTLPASNGAFRLWSVRHRDDHRARAAA